MIVGKFLGLDIIQDDSVKEIRVPSSFLEVVRKSINFVKAEEEKELKDETRMENL